jgi:hypothetical protein
MSDSVSQKPLPKREKKAKTSKPIKTSIPVSKGGLQWGGPSSASGSESGAASKEDARLESDPKGKESSLGEPQMSVNDDKYLYHLNFECETELDPTILERFNEEFEHNGIPLKFPPYLVPFKE